MSRNHLVSFGIAVAVGLSWSVVGSYLTWKERHDLAAAHSSKPLRVASVEQHRRELGAGLRALPAKEGLEESAVTTTSSAIERAAVPQGLPSVGNGVEVGEYKGSEVRIISANISPKLSATIFALITHRREGLVGLEKILDKNGHQQLMVRTEHNEELASLGFEDGDILVGINGSEIENSSDIALGLRDMEGGWADVDLLRKGQRRRISFTYGS